METPLPPEVPARKTSGTAITSLILGACSFVFCCLTGLPAVIFGIVSLVQISKNPLLQGKALAIVGLVLGGLSLAASPIMMSLAIPAIAVAIEKAEQVKEVNDIRQVGLAMTIYAKDHDGKFPASFEELVNSGALPEESRATLLYKENSMEPRWEIEQGLDLNSEEDAVLLRSVEVQGTNRNRGRAVFYVKGSAKWEREDGEEDASAPY